MNIKSKNFKYYVVYILEDGSIVNSFIKKSKEELLKFLERNKNTKVKVEEIFGIEIC